ncbi:ExbD/TolR family protein [Thiohalorhabdus sp.]|uniref:ExbD/TolR family protein n=1 Tax=Thiohalorhabdus sp. TaxID=3094134 RepID=UPI002FC3C2DE
MKFRGRSEQSPTIELTPLIDVVFLLLIFFMISTTFVSRSGLQVQVPEAQSSQANPDRERIEVMVTEAGEYLIGGEGLSADTSLEQALQKRAKGGEKPLLVIRADKNAKHRAVVGAMDAGKATGLTRIAISSREPTRGKAP